MSVSYLGSGDTTTSQIFAYPGGNVESTIVEIAAVSIPRRVVFWADVDAVTVANTRIRMYVKIDGTNYRLHQTFTFSGTQETVNLETYTFSQVKFTLQHNSVTPINIPYQIYVVY